MQVTIIFKELATSQEPHTHTHTHTHTTDIMHTFKYNMYKKYTCKIYILTIPFGVSLFEFVFENNKSVFSQI